MPKLNANGNFILKTPKGIDFLGTIKENANPPILGIESIEDKGDRLFKLIQAFIDLGELYLEKCKDELSEEKIQCFLEATKQRSGTCYAIHCFGAKELVICWL